MKICPNLPGTRPALPFRSERRKQPSRRRERPPCPIIPLHTSPTLLFGGSMWSRPATRDSQRTGINRVLCKASSSHSCSNSFPVSNSSSSKYSSKRVKWPGKKTYARAFVLEPTSSERAIGVVLTSSFHPWERERAQLHRITTFKVIQNFGVNRQWGVLDRHRTRKEFIALASAKISASGKRGTTGAEGRDSEGPARG